MTSAPGLGLRSMCRNVAANEHESHRRHEHSSRCGPNATAGRAGLAKGAGESRASQFRAAPVTPHGLTAHQADACRRKVDLRFVTAKDLAGVDSIGYQGSLP